MRAKRVFSRLSGGANLNLRIDERIVGAVNQAEIRGMRSTLQK
jgi:hypothetical protein